MFTSGGSAAWAFAGLAIGVSAAGCLLAWLGFLLGRGSQRQSHREALHQARQAARLRQDLSPGSAWRTDAGHRLLDWPGGGPFTGSALAGLFDADSEAGRALAEALHAQAPLGPLVLSAREPDRLGGQHWSLRALPCFDAAGAFDGHLGVAVCSDESLQASPAAFVADPQDRAEAAEAAAAAAAAAAKASAADAADRNARQASDAASDSFSLTVAHDLRAPIRVVEGFARIVKEDYGRQLDRVANDHLDRVLGAAARMNLMIDALLTLARLSTQPLARQPVNLSQLAGYVVEDLKRGAPERDAEFEIEPGLSVRGDPTLLRLVLENLLGNAWKYTGRTARAQISLRSLPLVDPAGAPDLRTFEVRDNGAGFDMRHAERLFGLFQRLHSANDFPGHGVGLASVKRIVQRHGGDIWAESEAGRGAAFVFTLAA